MLGTTARLEASAVTDSAADAGVGASAGVGVAAAVHRAAGTDVTIGDGEAGMATAGAECAASTLAGLQ